MKCHQVHVAVGSNQQSQVRHLCGLGSLRLLTGNDFCESPTGQPLVIRSQVAINFIELTHLWLVHLH